MSLIVLFYNLRVRNPICLLSNPIAGQRHQGCIIMSESQDKQNYSQALCVWSWAVRCTSARGQFLTIYWTSTLLFR